jgi:hypothetical protein
MAKMTADSVRVGLDNAAGLLTEAEAVAKGFAPSGDRDPVEMGRVLTGLAMGWIEMTRLASDLGERGIHFELRVERR